MPMIDQKAAPPREAFAFPDRDQADPLRLPNLVLPIDTNGPLVTCKACGNYVTARLHDILIEHAACLVPATPAAAPDSSEE